MRPKGHKVLEITTRVGCKVSCAYCPQGKLTQAHRKRSNVPEMSFDIFRRCIDKVPPEADILFAGMGEPWLNPACTDMLLYAHDRGHRIAVSTTLTGMRLSDVDRFRGVPFRYFCVHLPAREGYENITVDEHCLALLGKIKRGGIRNLFYRVFGTLPEEVRSLLEGEKNITRPPLHTRAGNLENRNRAAPLKKSGVLICTLAEVSLHHNILLPNGDVVLCCMDWGLRHVLGNLVSSDYGSLFRSEEFQKVKEGQKSESVDILCRHCDKYAYSLLEKLWKVDCIGSWNSFCDEVDRKVGLAGIFLRRKCPAIYSACKKIYGK